MSVDFLIRQYYRYNPDGHFFDRNTLSFFGERISDMRVLKDKAVVDGRECYVLSSYQRKHPSGARRTYYYFDSETFDYVID